MNSSSSITLLACTSLKATAWILTVRMEEICLVSYLEESPAPQIKDLDVWTDWVSSPGTVALSTEKVVAVKEEAEHWLTAHRRQERSQVPGMSAGFGIGRCPVAALNSLQRGDDP